MLKFESSGAVLGWRLLLLMAIMIISGCTRIKSYFPDKQIDYRHSAELPVLEIPVDLLNNELARQIDEVKRAAKVVETTMVQSSATLPEQQVLPLTQVVRLVSYTGGSPRLLGAERIPHERRSVDRGALRVTFLRPGGNFSMLRRVPSLIGTSGDEYAAREGLLPRRTAGGAVPGCTTRQTVCHGGPPGREHPRRG